MGVSQCPMSTALPGQWDAAPVPKGPDATEGPTVPRTELKTRNPWPCKESWQQQGSGTPPSEGKGSGHGYRTFWGAEPRLAQSNPAEAAPAAAGGWGCQEQKAAGLGMRQCHSHYRDREKELPAPESPPVPWDMEVGTFTVMTLDRGQQPASAPQPQLCLAMREKG